jgi:hypothetical protein
MTMIFLPGFWEMASLVHYHRPIQYLLQLTLEAPKLTTPQLPRPLPPLQPK